ncbi:MAG: HAD superfamily hydrolase (TIGR01549 family) [Hyphomicrobiaceae bacterium]|jgi:HAD superfamily hydrolase (TIGR01549 family)
MNAAVREPEVLIFDLFGTLVDLDWSTLPRVQIGDRERVITIPGLEELLAEAGQGVQVETFLDQVDAVGPLVVEGKRRTGTEQSSALRFRVALERCGFWVGRNELAIEMSLRHMRTLAASVRFPVARRETLQSLAQRYRIALVSNFDHGPTARAILDSTGLSALCEVSIISDEMGARKPQSILFHQACRLLSVTPEQCWYIGDTFDDDVVGAVNAGLVAVWIDEGHESDRPLSPALARIRDVNELPEILRRRYGS